MVLRHDWRKWGHLQTRDPEHRPCGMRALDGVDAIPDLRAIGRKMAENVSPDHLGVFADPAAVLLASVLEQ